MEALHIPAEIRNVLQRSFENVASLASTQLNDNSGPKAPEPSPLKKAVIFSNRFVPTYLVVVLFVVTISSILRLHFEWTREKRLQSRRETEKGSPQSTSSAGSTIVVEDETSSKNGATTEQTPLLSRQALSVTKVSSISRLACHTKAFLLRQPKPVFAITASSNQLPANGTSSLVSIFFLVNVFYLVYGIPINPAVRTFALAHRSGLCFVVNLPVLYLIGAKNNQPLKWLTGWSYEKVNIFHRRLGEWMTVVALVHFSCMLLTWYSIIRPQGFSLSWFLTRHIIYIGLGALTCYLLIWITSIGYVRQEAYEFFLASHIFLQVAALVFLFLHHSSARPYCGAALAIWVLDRGISRILLSNQKFIATLEIAQDKQTVLVYCNIPLDKSKRYDIRCGWNAGQHVFLSVPGMKWYHAKQAHPFTIASPAPSTDAPGSWPLQLIIRCQDGFSKELLKYAEYHQHAEVYLDGPYGSSDLVEDIVSADRVCLIAGGSGITVTYPLAWSLWSKGRDTPVLSNRTVYRQGKKEKLNIELIQSEMQQQRKHFWVRQRPEHGSWITLLPAHVASLNHSTESTTRCNGVGLIDQIFETREDAGGFRPDITVEIKTWLQSDEKSTFDRNQRVCLVVCGPDGLVRDVRNCVASFVRQGYNIQLRVEKFGW